jgi:lipoate-protein ligase A
LTPVTGIAVGHRSGSAAELHAVDAFGAGPIDVPHVWRCEVTAPAIVLGSRQTHDVLDLDACARRGLAIVRRRSGGGAVLVEPGAIVWIDVVLPHGVAPDDIRGSMEWVGECWRDALGRLGATTTALTVHRGPMVCTPWSDLVCFAGTGPGEVLIGGRKLVGLSQRRTRDGIRVQCQTHRRPLVAAMPELFATPVRDHPLHEAAVLADALLDATVTDAAVAEALAAAIGDRIATDRTTRV